MSSLFQSPEFKDEDRDGEIWLLEGNTIKVIPDGNLLSKERCLVVKRFDLLKVLETARNNEDKGSNPGKLECRFTADDKHFIIIEFNGDIMTSLLEQGFVKSMEQLN